MERLRRVWAAGPRDLALLVRMSAWSLALPVLKHALPLPRLVRLMALNPATAPAPGRHPDELLKLAWWSSRLQAWRFPRNCLERSLVAYRYMGRSGESASLVVGGRHVGDDFSGHVWIEIGGEPIGEAPATLQDLTPIVEFDPRGRRMRPRRASTAGPVSVD